MNIPKDGFQTLSQKTQIVLIVILLFTVVPLSSQTPHNAKEIMRSVNDLYNNISQIQFSVTLNKRSVSESRVNNLLNISFKISVRFPNRYREEIDENQYLKDLGINGSIVEIFDGENTWTYFSNRNQYGVKSGAPYDDLKEHVFEVLCVPVHGTGIKLKDDEAALLREESIKANENQINCYVIEIPEDKKPDYDPQWWTLWVDTRSHIVWRVERRSITPKGSNESTITFQSVKINEPIPDGDFTFTPPTGAQKITFPAF